MEGAEPDAFGALADRFHHARLHLARGFVREGQAKDVFAGQLRIRFQEVTDSLGDHARFAGSGAGDDEERPFAMFHGTALLSVQRGEVFT
jgi:hypothetical protein